MKGAKKPGVRVGNWLTAEQAATLWQTLPDDGLQGKRDRALLAVLLACCGLRRHEAVSLEMHHVQQREDHWAMVDLHGKAGHTRTVPVPDWVKMLLDRWTQAAAIQTGKIFRRVRKAGTVWAAGMTEKVAWDVVHEYAAAPGIATLAPHDLRGSCSRLCHSAGGELEQIQFLPGHVSIQTTERAASLKRPCAQLPDRRQLARDSAEHIRIGRLMSRPTKPTVGCQQAQQELRPETKPHLT